MRKMYIRRYYPQGQQFEKTYTNDYFQEMITRYGIDLAIQLDTANYEFVFEDKSERKAFLKESYDRVMNDPRFYLDNLDSLPTFSCNSRINSEHVTCFTIDGTLVN